MDGYTSAHKCTLGDNGAILCSLLSPAAMVIFSAAASSTPSDLSCEWMEIKDQTDKKKKVDTVQDSDLFHRENQNGYFTKRFYSIKLANRT